MNDDHNTIRAALLSALATGTRNPLLSARAAGRVAGLTAPAMSPSRLSRVTALLVNVGDRRG